MNRSYPLLFVEGHKSDRLLLQNALGRCGYGLDALVCASAEEALDHLNHAAVPELIVTAVSLPDMDSDAFLHQLYAHPRARLVPVVLWGKREELSAHAGDRQVLTGLSPLQVEKGETLGEYIRGLQALLDQCMCQRLSA
ncbi:response regulator [Deinococcus navajonensis]|uniref:Two-component system response regulator n=1 Tax=Deinococcus navajonensis TaxID=309884 RepID=A0ABV8XHR7_9DEIO